jgi:ATP-dependent helicase HrpA
VLGVDLKASYRFEPGAEDDGVALDVPLVLLPQLGEGELDGTIPAWREQKITALLEELPRALRRELGDIRGLGAELSRRVASSEGSLYDSLSRALLELAFADIAPEQFRPDAIPAYLNFYFRIRGERGQVLGEGRDLGQLCERFVAQAREVVRNVAPPERFQRSDIITWDFDELPLRVMRRVHGSEVAAFPALVERGSSVAIELFETAEAAERAHLAGVRRLLELACKSALSALDRRMPPPLPRVHGLPPSRAEQAAFVQSLRSRITSDAFALAAGCQLPRARADFERLLIAGKPRLTSSFETVLELLAEIRAELDLTLRALHAAKAQPSGAVVGADIRLQLDWLLAPDLLQNTEPSRLAHIPRYLAAARARLARAIYDPRKDASKAAPLAALLRAFAAKYPSATDRSAAQRLLFAIEELRVATFAPELRPAKAPSIVEATRAVGELT